MNIRTIAKKFWLFGPAAGLVFSLLVTAVFTTMDWVRNFGGIFRDPSGTNWAIVYETAISWFVPSLIYMTIVASLGHLMVSGIRLVYREYFSGKSDASNT